jgi:hypothetical protein
VPMCADENICVQMCAYLHYRRMEKQGDEQSYQR